jgi:hypothetical protein
MPTTLQDSDWATLLKRIKGGKCTPFLGAGVSADILPLGGVIAADWADKHGFPFEHGGDLPRVAQFYSLKAADPLTPKEELCELIRAAGEPPFTHPDQPHRVLADLALPIYITTNYDDFMARAIVANRPRGAEPRQEVCRWNSYVKQYGARAAGLALDASPAHPIVYHLHGHVSSPESLVLTEDDYLDFLVEVNRNPDLLHPRIREAFAGTSLLFIGYSLTDLTFRVLFRLIVKSMEASLQRINVAVQLLPNPRSGITPEEAQDYLDRYLSRNMNVRTYWGTAQDFAAELRKRWRLFNGLPESEYPG